MSDGLGAACRSMRYADVLQPVAFEENYMYIMVLASFVDLK
jgi:hypothetical protein